MKTKGTKTSSYNTELSSYKPKSRALFPFRDRGQVLPQLA